MNLQDDLIAFARDVLGLAESVSIDLFPIEGRGSDRTFFRLRWNPSDSAILIHYDPKRIENSYYADIALFLNEIHVPVPRLIRHDPVRYFLVTEDLGDTDLWSYRDIPWEARKILYQKTLTIIHRLHSFPEKNFPVGRVKLMEGFGPDLYRWERDYFKNHFIRDVCGVELEPLFERALEAELSNLAELLEGTKRSLVHRDFQSQNVMIQNGKPFLMDFQGMRFGTLFYDLGSLLFDPYVKHADHEREELLSYYYGLSKRDLDWADFRTHFWEASAQRLMQCLGAYGFLGLEKGLKAFLKHIPAGLVNLQLAVSHIPSLSCLRQLSAECQKGMEQKGYPG